MSSCSSVCWQRSKAAFKSINKVICQFQKLGCFWSFTVNVRLIVLCCIVYRKEFDWLSVFLWLIRLLCKWSNDIVQHSWCHIVVVLTPPSTAITTIIKHCGGVEGERGHNGVYFSISVAHFIADRKICSYGTIPIHACLVGVCAIFCGSSFEWSLYKGYLWLE